MTAPATPPTAICLDIEGPTLSIAIVQLDSAFPNDKRAIFIRGRESFEWVSSSVIDARKTKAFEILRFISEKHPKTNLIVFPEYTLPVETMLKDLQDWTNENGVIVMAGADAIWQKDNQTIYNQAPLFIPGREEPIWITKRRLSQWEGGKVDEPKDHSNPAFTWEHEGNKYWIVLHTCFDFLLAIKEALPSDKDPVIHIASMCSPDLDTFRTYADTMLWEEGGRAVILCNAGGEAVSGHSSVFVVTPQGTRLKPAFEMSHRKEGLAVLDLDVDRFVLPRRTTAETQTPLKVKGFYEIEEISDQVYIKPVSEADHEMPQTRAIINPALFAHLGKKLRVTFIGVDAYGAINEEQVRKQGFECYSVLGHNDMMVSHLHQNAHAMVADISENLPCRFRHVRLSGDPNNTKRSQNRFPYFEVEVFHKVLGHEITEDDLRAFDITPPLTDDIRDLIALGDDWNASVSEEFRESCIKRYWLLGTTGLEPGGIKAAMTIYLDYPDEIEVPLSDFDAHILPHLKANPAITSIYEGVGHRLPVHYLLRVDCAVDDLFSLIQDIHNLAVKARLILSTNTYVIVRRWSKLDLLNNLILTEITAVDSRYRDRHILPYLSSEERIQCTNSSAEEQTELVATHRTLITLIKYLNDKNWMMPHVANMEKELATGLFKKDYQVLTGTHNILLSRTESNLRQRIDEALPDETDLNAHKQAIGIQQGKTKQKLTYTERLQVLIHCCKEGVIDSAILPDLQHLFDVTKDVRNAFAHSDWARLNNKAYAQALVAHCEFLRRWDDE